MIGCSTDIVSGTCGLGVFFEFEEDEDGWCDWDLKDAPLGGIDYAVAGFVDDLICKKAYKIIKEQHDIVFQSPVKQNRNSGNQFFFIVFKRKETV